MGSARSPHTLTAGHPRGVTAVTAVTAVTPQGILEAYWCYVEGIKPEAETPNSLIGAQPMVVKSLDEAFVALEVGFRAPPTAGKYPIKVCPRRTPCTVTLCAANPNPTVNSIRT